MADVKHRLTLACEAEATLEEKRSVFIADAAPVSSEEEARTFLEKIRHKYADANHHVYAYDLAGGVVSRYSDDSQPQGTAGMPVLNVIKMSGATDVCVVVTRYFGGTLLGTGGLVRAYSGAAKLALDAAGIVEMAPFSICEIHCSYAEYQRLTVQLPKWGASEENASFGSDVTVTAATPVENTEALDAAVSELTKGKTAFSVIGTEERAAKHG